MTEQRVRTEDQILTGDMGLSATVRLIISDSGDTVRVNVDHPVVIGRNDPSQVVDVDLAPLGGYRLGISRQHIQMETRSEGLFVRDLRSRNGTLLNGQSLTPMLDYPLHNGDTLQLHRMTIHVEFSH